jgi:hypothetical protein
MIFRLAKVRQTNISKCWKEWRECLSHAFGRRANIGTIILGSSMALACEERSGAFWSIPA